MSNSFKLDLTGIAHGGYAIGRHKKQVIFVPYTLPGETITARITEQKKRFAHGEVVELLKLSPNRIEASCPHFGAGQCGGCQWQHIDYTKQRHFKHDIVVDQLKRLGKFSNPKVRKTIASPDQWNYRSHMTFARSPDGGGLGFHRENHKGILPVEVCHILHPALVDIYEQLELDDENIERVKFQVGSDPEDRMIVIQASKDVVPEVEVDFPVSVNLLLNDNEPVNLIGRSFVEYKLYDRTFRVTAGGFFQVNLPVAEILVDEVISRLDLQGGETVLDLYSGVGLFTAFIAERADLVISVESYPPAVTDADENLADLENVDLVEGSVEEVLDDIGVKIDAVVVDPPRNGLSAGVVKNLLRLKPAKIVYVSCDPATFARDARKLCDNGYRLLDVQPLDMFPQTFHIECVSTLIYKGK